MFSQACVKNSVHRAGVYPSIQWAEGVYTPQHTPSWAYTTPRPTHNPHADTQAPGRHTTPGQTHPPTPRWSLKRAVCILLECILVETSFCTTFGNANSYETFRNVLPRNCGNISKSAYIDRKIFFPITQYLGL